ncbi:MAG: SBBP repeat-containing protein [bacterium]
MKIFLTVLFLCISCSNSEQIDADENVTSECVEKEGENWDFILEDISILSIVPHHKEGYVGVGSYTEPFYYGEDYELVDYSVVVKLDGDFSLEWGASFAEVELGRTYIDIAVADNNKIYAAGTNADQGFLLTRFSEEGVPLWHKEWKHDISSGAEGTQQNRIYSIASGNDGLYLSGFAAGFGNNGFFYPTIYFAKTDFEGDLIWEKMWGPEGSTVVSMDIDSEDSIYMTGYTVGSMEGQENAGEPGDCDGLPMGPEGSSCPDPFLIKVDKNGEILWIRQFGSEAISLADIGEDVLVDNKNNIYVLSGSSICRGNVLLLRKYSPDGKLLWELIHNDEFDQSTVPVSMHMDRFGTLIVSGKTYERKTTPAEGVLFAIDSDSGEIISEIRSVNENAIFFKGVIEKEDFLYAYGFEHVGFNENHPDPTKKPPIYDFGFKKYDYFYKDSKSDTTFTEGDDIERESVQFGSTKDDDAVFSFKDNSGDLFVAGNTRKDFISGEEFEKKAFIVKYNEKKEKEWVKYYGSDKWDNVSAGYLDNEGNIILSGTTLGNFEGNENDRVGEVFVIKIDKNGEVIWSDQLGSDNNDWARNMWVDKKGNIFITGGTWGSIDENIYSGNFRGDVFVGKWNSKGQKQWVYQTGLMIEGLALTGGKDGNVYVSGRNPGYSSSTGETVWYDNVILKLNEKGEKSNVETWSSSKGCSPADITMDSEGNIYVTGYTLSSLEENEHLGVDCPGGYCPDAYLTKFDSDLKMEWTKQFGSEHDDRATAVYADEDGNVFVTGAIGKNRYCEIESDIFLAVFDTEGREYNFLQWGTAGEERPNDIIVENEDIIITGFTSGGLDGNENAGGKDAFVTIIPVSAVW